jgi:magnesium chelatase family protein
MLAAATNPCPCGHGGDACRCTTADLARHRRRLSGPLLDRLDVLVAVHRPTAAELGGGPVAQSSSVRNRVAEARSRQRARTGCPNAAAPAEVLTRCLATSAATLLREVYERGTISARGRVRALRVARTIADLEGSLDVTAEHVLEALGLRQDQADVPVAA